MKKDLDLGSVVVRPVRGDEERRRWDRLMSEHHYLPLKRGLYGQSLRHVAESGGEWVALVGWTSGAFKVGVRDAWLGWSRERQFRRLKLVANNSRFAVLNEGGVRNLASRVLGLSLRRLSGDMEAAHGFPVLVAETFVDPSRFAGTCYRASNWRRLGLTRGYRRLPGGSPRWEENGQPKEVWVYELVAGGREALAGPVEPAEWGVGPKGPGLDAEGLRSLHEFLSRVPEYRSARGIRYSLACYLAIMVAARLAGYRGVTAFAEFAERLDQERRRAVGAFRSPSKGRYTVPRASTFHLVLSELPPDALDGALRAWSAQHAGDGAVAMDGKDIRGASRRLPAGERQLMVAAVEHGSGLVLGQLRAGARGEEVAAVRTLSRELGLRGRTVTLDAVHAQAGTARLLSEELGAEYLATVKGNQPKLLAALEAMDWGSARWSAEASGRGHGREERRRCAAIDLDGPEWAWLRGLPGRRQAVRVDRGRTVLSTGARSDETAYLVTSLGADVAGPEELLRLARGHWEVENRLHYVRDFTYDEDRCRAAAGHLPRNLSALTNAAVSIIRVMGRFENIPPANRHYAARPEEALDAVMGFRGPAGRKPA